MYLSTQSVADLRQMLHANPEEPLRSSIIIHINHRPGAHLGPMHPCDAFQKMSYARLREIEESELVEAARAEIKTRETSFPPGPMGNL